MNEGGRRAIDSVDKLCGPAMLDELSDETTGCDGIWDYRR